MSQGKTIASRGQTHIILSCLSALQILFERIDDMAVLSIERFDIILVHPDLWRE
jgi:hypothetical protein